MRLATVLLKECRVDSFLVSITGFDGASVSESFVFQSCVNSALLIRPTFLAAADSQHQGQALEVLDLGRADAQWGPMPVIACAVSSADPAAFLTIEWDDPARRWGLVEMCADGVREVSHGELHELMGVWETRSGIKLPGLTLVHCGRGIARIQAGVLERDARNPWGLVDGRQYFFDHGEAFMPHYRAGMTDAGMRLRPLFSEPCDMDPSLLLGFGGVEVLSLACLNEHGDLVHPIADRCGVRWDVTRKWFAPIQADHLVAADYARPC